uniref:Uncharacterized protein n=1 Tax=Tanacetum cinerariifolium TaxID=118510 RepID=A0A6L2MHS8_TANCI|nr:hypothetical protein [Tanacetum cinerariifolium]
MACVNVYFELGYLDCSWKLPFASCWYKNKMIVGSSSFSTHIENSHSNQNQVRIIPGPAGIVQQAKLLKKKVFILGSDGALMSTQEYMQKVVEDVGEDDDFKSGSWDSANNYVNTNGGTVTGYLGDMKNFLKNEKLDQVVAIVKSSSLNAIGDLTVTMKDLTCTIPGTNFARIDLGGLVIGDYKLLGHTTWKFRQIGKKSV